MCEKCACIKLQLSSLINSNKATLKHCSTNMSPTLQDTYSHEIHICEMILKWFNDV